MKSAMAKERDRRYYEEHREEIRRKKREWEERHREWLLANMRTGVCSGCGRTAAIPPLSGGLCPDCVVHREAAKLRRYIDRTLAAREDVNHD